MPFGLPEITVTVFWFSFSVSAAWRLTGNGAARLMAGATCLAGGATC